MDAIQPGVAAITGAFSNFGKAVGPILNWIIGILVAVFIPIWDTVVGAVGGALGGLGRIFSGLMIVLSGVINFISALFTGDWAALWESVKQIFWGVWQTILGLIQTIGGVIGGAVAGLINGIIGFFTYLYDVLVGHSIVPDMIAAIILWFWKLPGQIFGIVAGFVAGVIGFISTLPGRAISAIAPFVQGIVSKATEAWNGFKAAVSTGINNAVNTVKELPEELGGRVILTDPGSNAYRFSLVEGRPFGVIEAYTLVRDAQGRLLLDDQGKPQVDQNFKEVGNCNFERFAKFHQEMLKKGFYFACSQYEAGFICTKITNKMINQCIKTADIIMKDLK